MIDILYYQLMPYNYVFIKGKAWSKKFLNIVVQLGNTHFVSDINPNV